MSNKRKREDKDALSRLLNDKQFQLGSVNNFTSNSKIWKKEDEPPNHFSIIELIWRSIISDFKEMNATDSEIEGIRLGLFSTIKTDNGKAYPALEYYVSEVLQMNLAVYIVLTSKSELLVINDLVYIEKLRSGELGNHINISLNKQIKDVFREISKIPNYCELTMLSDEEVLVMDALRSKRYKFINISMRNNGKLRQLEGVEEINKSMTLEDVKELMDEGEHQNIEIKRHHGKIVCVHRRERKRLLI